MKKIFFFLPLQSCLWMSSLLSIISLLNLLESDNQVWSFALPYLPPLSTPAKRVCLFSQRWVWVILYLSLGTQLAFCWHKQAAWFCTPALTSFCRCELKQIEFSLFVFSGTRHWKCCPRVCKNWSAALISVVLGKLEILAHRDAGENIMWWK